MKKIYVIDLSQYNIPSTVNVVAGYGLYEILKTIFVNTSIAQTVTDAFLRL